MSAQTLKKITMYLKKKWLKLSPSATDCFFFRGQKAEWLTLIRPHIQRVCACEECGACLCDSDVFR